MLFLHKNRFFATILNRISERGAMPWHAPTTDCWPTGEGIFPQPYIKISGWNVNGFRSILEKGNLSNFIETYEPDFMCLNQTKIDYKSYLNLSPFAKKPFPKYEAYWNFCKIKSGYSGVAIFAKHKPLSVIEDFPEMLEYSLEGRVLTLQYEKFFIICIYNPTSGMQLERLAFRTQQFDKEFKAHVQSLKAIKPVVIFGDMNVAHHEIDLAKPKGKDRVPGFTQEERSNFTNFLQQAKLIDTYRKIHPYGKKYSWWNYRTYARRYNDGWRLDYILADHRMKVESAAIHTQIMGSDHCPVSAVVRFQEQNEIK